MDESPVSPTGTPLRNSLWNLVYRVISATDHSKTAWEAILRGGALYFFKEPVDDLPTCDNDASRRSFKDRFFALPDHRVYDLLEFLLADDRAGMKEVDRKLIRHSLNEVLDRESAPVRLLRDTLVPLPDSLGLDDVATAQEGLTLFTMEAASRHLASAIAYLSRRPEPESQAAVREAVLAVAAVVRSLSGEKGEVSLGTVSPVSARRGIPRCLHEGIETLLRRCHSVSGLPGAPSLDAPADARETALLVVFCSSVIAYLLPVSGGT